MRSLGDRGALISSIVKQCPHRLRRIGYHDRETKKDYVYAMDMGFDPQTGRSSIRGVAVEPVSGTPLFVLLSRAFVTYRGCYERASADYGDSPSLGVWSNVLRPFDDGVLDQRELIRRGVLSRRAVRALVRDLERLGWLEEERPARGQTSLRLTDAGLRAREAGRILVDEAEQGFVDRFGAQATSALRETLVGIAGQLEVELPWHLTGYGVADSSLTGGQHVPAQPGPPRTPAHGADWPVVLRNPAADVSVQPLSALLSKALAAFRIDYEWDMRGHGTGLDFIANFLRFVDDDGVDLKTASTMGGVTGNGRSALERHFVVVVEPRQGRGASRRVYLTPKGKQARDTYPFLVAKVEREWQGRYGACVDDLRGVLESLDRDFDAGLPGYPSTTDWLYRSMLAGSAAARVTKKRTDMNEGRNPGGIP